MQKVAICILAHNCADTIQETIESCLSQHYFNLEVYVMENGSTDNTLEVLNNNRNRVKIKSIKENIGCAKNMERCFKVNADIIVLMCADDMFDSNYAIDSIVSRFNDNNVGCVLRHYYQFSDKSMKPIRFNHSKNPYQLADNPSGLAFRKKSLLGVKVDISPFIEAASIFKQILDKGYTYGTITWDIVAVRIGNNGSRSINAYHVSPIKSWWELTHDIELIRTLPISLIQIKNWGSYYYLLREIKEFIKIDKTMLVRPDFIFYSLVALIIPRFILRPLVDIVKERIVND